ncbi:MAG: hypothetical protein ACHQ9S_17325 [Candidatus Binatia bacterium]
MKRVMVAAAMVLGLCVACAAAHLALIEVGREVVVLHEWTPGGAVKKTRLWIVDEGGYSWLHHFYADSVWFRRLATDPIVTLERGGRVRQYRALPDPESHQRVHQLLREKYGIADRWVRFVSGETERCAAVPVRLEPVEGQP